MSSEIRISQDEMIAKASMFDTKRDELAAVVKELGIQADRLLDEWHGQSSTTFNETFHSYDQTFIDVENLITDMAQQIRDVASSMTEVDQTIAAKIGRL